METITRCQPYEKKGKRYAELTNAVTYCIAKDSLPIHTVERTGFKAMLRAFDSRYEIPSRNYVLFTNCTAIALLLNKRKGHCRNTTSAFLFCNHRHVV